MSEFSQPRLLQKPIDVLFAGILLLLVLSLSLTFQYQKFLELKTFTWHETQATLIKQERRQNSQGFYELLELTNDSLHFYTQTKEPIKYLVGYELTLVFLTQKINFFDYLRRFFAYSKLLGVSQEKILRYQFIDTIHKAHQERLLANLYGALFFVEPLSKDLRQKLSKLGVNHLAALSGFHLGFLALMLTYLFKLLLRPVQRRYFPYLHRNRLSMILVLILLFIYLAFLNFVPSLLRAYVMIFLGFIFYDRGLKVLSFELLFVTVLFILALDPAMLFALGFWFSVLGVGMIFLLLKHYDHLGKWQLLLLINISVFILMIPFVLYAFQLVSWGQLLSPLLSLLFSLFYPFSLLLHLLGWGGFFDTALLGLLNLECETFIRPLEGSVLYIYSGVLVLGIFSKRWLILSLIFALVLFIQALAV